MAGNAISREPVCERELRDSSVRAGMAYLLEVTEELGAINAA